MKIRCISKLPNEDQAKVLGAGRHYWPDKQQFGLVVGQEYVVFGLSILDGVPWVEILSDFEYLYSVPLCLFEIVDGRVSRYWEIRIDENDDLRLWPSLFYTEYFYDDLVESVAEVVTRFKQIREQIEAEFAFG